jgi:hypothetical protein
VSTIRSESATRQFLRVCYSMPEPHRLFEQMPHVD